MPQRFGLLPPISGTGLDGITRTHRRTEQDYSPQPVKFILVNPLPAREFLPCFVVISSHNPKPPGREAVETVQSEHKWIYSYRGRLRIELPRRPAGVPAAD